MKLHWFKDKVFPKRLKSGKIGRYLVLIKDKRTNVNFWEIQMYFETWMGEKNAFAGNSNNYEIYKKLAWCELPKLPKRGK